MLAKKNSHLVMQLNINIYLLKGKSISFNGTEVSSDFMKQK